MPTCISHTCHTSFVAFRRPPNLRDLLVRAQNTQGSYQHCRSPRMFSLQCQTLFCLPLHQPIPQSHKFYHQEKFPNRHTSPLQIKLANYFILLLVPPVTNNTLAGQPQRTQASQIPNQTSKTTTQIDVNSFPLSNISVHGENLLQTRRRHFTTR